MQMCSSAATSRMLCYLLSSLTQALPPQVVLLDGGCMLVLGQRVEPLTLQQNGNALGREACRQQWCRRQMTGSLLGVQAQQSMHSSALPLCGLDQPLALSH